MILIEIFPKFEAACSSSQALNHGLKLSHFATNTKPNILDRSQLQNQAFSCACSRNAKIS